MQAADKLIEGAQWLLGKIDELIKGALAPIWMYKDTYD